jgi:hypothetical protein
LERTNIGIDKYLGAAAMALLWNKTFTARRDQLTGPDAKPQEQGLISRQLKAELLEAVGGRKALDRHK